MKHYDMLLENKSYVTAETLKNALQGFTLKQNTLMQEMAALVEEKRLSLGIAITASTYRKYITIHKHLKGFLYHKYEVSDILFGQVDFAFLEAFNYYLKVCLQLFSLHGEQLHENIPQPDNASHEQGACLSRPVFRV